MIENERVIEGLKDLHQKTETLSRDIKKYLKKNKSDVIGAIESEFGSKISGQLDDSLTDIKEKTINLAHYFDDEINYDMAGEMVGEIFEEIEERAYQIVELMEELSDVNKRKFNNDEIISKFLDKFMPQIEEIHEIVEDTLKLNDIN